jgi:hypothetical protein
VNASARGTRFHRKALQQVGPICDTRQKIKAQRLDGDRTIDLSVITLVDDADRTSTYQTVHTILADARYYADVSEYLAALRISRHTAGSIGVSGIHHSCSPDVFFVFTLCQLYACGAFYLKPHYLAKHSYFIYDTALSASDIQRRSTYAKPTHVGKN